MDAFGKTLLNAVKSFGDFLVTTFSAGSIPNAPSTTYPIVDEYSLQVDIGRRVNHPVQLLDNGEHPIPIHRHLRNLPVSRERILEILTGRAADQGAKPNELAAGPFSIIGQAAK